MDVLLSGSYTIRLHSVFVYFYNMMEVSLGVVLVKKLDLKKKPKDPKKSLFIWFRFLESLCDWVDFWTSPECF